MTSNDPTIDDVKKAADGLRREFDFIEGLGGPLGPLAKRATAIADALAVLDAQVEKAARTVTISVTTTGDAVARAAHTDPSQLGANLGDDIHVPSAPWRRSAGGEGLIGDIVEHSPACAPLEQARMAVVRFWLREELAPLGWWGRLRFWWRLWRSA